MLLPETVDAGPVVSRLTREAAEGTLTGLAIEPAARPRSVARSSAPAAPSRTARLCSEPHAPASRH